MPYTDEGKGVMLAAAREAISYLSIHSDKPTLNNELPRGIYSRQRISLGYPEDGSMRSLGKVIFQIPEGVRVAYAGFYDREIGGVLIAFDELIPRASFSGRGEYHVDLAVLDLNLCEIEGV